MGCDYSSLLIVGIKAEEVMGSGCEKKEVKKFNENTGEPYIKVVPRWFNTLFGKECDKDDVEDIITKIGLQYIQTGEEEYCIGRLLSDVDNVIDCVEISYLTKEWLEVGQILTEQGYIGGTYVIHTLYVSC